MAAVGSFVQWINASFTVFCQKWLRNFMFHNMQKIPNKRVYKAQNSSNITWQFYPITFHLSTSLTSHISESVEANYIQNSTCRTLIHIPTLLSTANFLHSYSPQYCSNLCFLIGRKRKSIILPISCNQGLYNLRGDCSWLRTRVSSYFVSFEVIKLEKLRAHIKTIKDEIILRLPGPRDTGTM